MKASERNSPAGAQTDVLTRIDRLRNEFSKSELHIAELLSRDTHAFARMNVKDVAARADVSEPTVVRFCRRVGCKGFKDFKIQIIQELAYRQASREDTGRSRASAASATHVNNATAQGIPGEVLDAAVAALQRTAKGIDRHAIEAAAELIAKARRVAIFGIGGSSAVMANEAHNRLFRLNISSIPYTDSYQQRMSATTLSEQDVALFISSTGRPRSLLDSLELAKYYGAKCVGIAPKDGPLGRELDICIDLELTQGGVNQFHPNPMRYAQLFAIDCIAYATALRMGPAAETSLKRTRASVASLHGIAPLQPIGD
ncbi:MAG TPA: MurR/RpiR family transcriptional regulator [Steroidobacter sp.]|uniref:MurR/RpiR family transcriptional regulator n=1 Tax=Steroidobacter sp. TaxID=1978227 RepID=UPI002ED9C894